MADIGASVGEVHRALGVVGKAREELTPYRDHFVALSARLGHLPRHDDILAVAEHPPKGVAGKRPLGRLLPCHDHSTVQSAGQRNPDTPGTVEIPREVTRE